MKHILAKANRGRLVQIARADALLGFDFDGTLAPIVAARESALMRKTTRRLLAEVARLYPCVVVSGRAQADVARRLRGIGLRAVIGNHGIEPAHASEALRIQVRRWLAELTRSLAPLRGIDVEDKGFSLTIHTRRVREKRKARAAISRAVSALEGARVVGGKEVVNVLPLGAPDKGIALERERARAGCDQALYVGDDLTDEDVFARGRPGRLLAIRVGKMRGSHASYCLRGQREIDELLRVLADERRASTGRRVATG
jgi:trehalose 6-phosphate phosphatase